MISLKYKNFKELKKLFKFQFDQERDLLSENQEPQKLERSKITMQINKAKQSETTCRTFVAFFAARDLFAPNNCPIWLI